MQTGEMKPVSDEELASAEQLANTILKAPEGYVSHAFVVMARAFLQCRRAVPDDVRAAAERIIAYWKARGITDRPQSPNARNLDELDVAKHILGVPHE